MMDYVIPGCIAFIGAMMVVISRPSEELPLSDKVVLGIFFVGAILCLGLSFAFHTVYCHSEFVGKLFSKYVYIKFKITKHSGNYFI